MTERTLVLLKPDCVQRGFMGEIISRFERAGFKIVGVRMQWISKEFATKHYDDLAERRGQDVMDRNVTFLTAGPIVAFVLEGVNAVENVRKLVGTTEPKASPPGTIRGDYAHSSFAYTDKKGDVVRNLVHASGDANDAKREIALWFSPKELHSYKTVHEIHLW